MERLGMVTAWVLCFIYGVITRGVVVAVLWSWFVAEKFNLPLLTVPEAAGLSTLCVYVLGGNYKKKPGETYAELLTDVATSATVLAVMALLLGWIIKCFV